MSRTSAKLAVLTLAGALVAGGALSAGTAFAAHHGKKPGHAVKKGGHKASPKMHAKKGGKKK